MRIFLVNFTYKNNMPYAYYINLIKTIIGHEKFLK